MCEWMKSLTHDWMNKWENEGCKDALNCMNRWESGEMNEMKNKMIEWTDQ